ncbi:MAG: hypothetical protein O3B04_04530 [Chloroflexi bacterium]|nr:hypothetical protein [Chloroflexota bacterium]MDA1297256.1 hypothetical protein [Chloroflexota bacterium]
MRFRQDALRFEVRVAVADICREELAVCEAIGHLPVAPVSDTMRSAMARTLRHV